MNKRAIQKYFELAKKLSKKSNHHTYSLGCVIASRKEIVGVGTNQIKTHPKSTHPYSMLHAEMHAIIGANPAHLLGADAFVYRASKAKNQTTALAKPCPYCMAMLRGVGVKRVYFTTTTGYDFIDLN